MAFKKKRSEHEAPDRGLAVIGEHGTPRPRRGRAHKAFGLIGVLAVMLAVTFGTGVATWASSSKSYLSGTGSGVGYGGYSTHWYEATLDDGTGTYSAYCLSPKRSSPSAGSYTVYYLDSSTLGLTETQQKMLVAIMYYGYGGPGYDTSMYPSTNYWGGSMGRSDYYTVTHVMVSRVYQASDSAAVYGTSSNYKKWVHNNIYSTSSLSDASYTLGKMYAAYSEIPESFIDSVYVINPSASTQPMISYDWEGEGDLEITKTVSGTDDTDVNFTFQVTLTDRNGDALTGSYSYTKYDSEGTVTSSGKKLSFNSKGQATFKLKAGATMHITGIPDGATYVVEETDLPDGYTCSTTSKSGTIKADETKSRTFTNKYSTSGSLSLRVKKTLDGSKTFSGSYKMTLTRTNSTFTSARTGDAAYSETVTVKKGNNPASFSKLTFDYDDVGTRYYTLVETIPDDATNSNVNSGNTTYENATSAQQAKSGWIYDGIVYDTTVWELTVVIEDDGDGTMTVTVTDQDGTTYTSNSVITITFENTSTSSLKVKKVVKNTEVDSDVFTFVVTVWDSDGNLITGKYPYIKYDADGNVADNGTGNLVFEDGQATFKLKAGWVEYIYNLPANSTYKVEETDIPDGYEHVTGSDSNVTGTIKAGKTMTAKIVNKYYAEVELTLGGTKLYYYGDELVDEIEEGIYKFVLNDITTGTAKELGTATNLSDGTFTFDEITYTLSDIGEHYYTIEEKIPSGATSSNDYTVDGVKYDTTVYTLYVKVTDNGDGTLSTTVKKNSSSGTTLSDLSAIVKYCTFKNYYSATGRWTATAQKILDGGLISEYYESFQFTLSRISSASLTVKNLTDGLVWEDGTSDTTQTKTVDSTGYVEFDSVYYTLSTLGTNDTATLYYKIVEVAPTGSDVVKNYTDDKNVYYTDGDGVIYLMQTVIYTVTIQDNGKGTIEVVDESWKVYDVDGEEVDTGGGPWLVNELEPGYLEIAKYLEEESMYDPSIWYVFHVTLTGENIEDYDLSSLSLTLSLTDEGEDYVASLNE